MRRETRSRRIAAVSLIVLAISVGPAIVHAQQATGAVAGRLFNSLSLDPVTTGTVTLEELKQQTAISPDGTYRFEHVPPGTYHLLVEAEGYVRTRQEVTVAATVVTLDVGVDPAAALQRSHFSQSGRARPVRVVSTHLGVERTVARA